jgi:hypothetical protein
MPTALDTALYIIHFIVTCRPTVRERVSKHVSMEMDSCEPTRYGKHVSMGMGDQQAFLWIWIRCITGNPGQHEVRCSRRQNIEGPEWRQVRSEWSQLESSQNGVSPRPSYIVITSDCKGVTNKSTHPIQTPSYKSPIHVTIYIYMPKASHSVISLSLIYD